VAQSPTPQTIRAEPGRSTDAGYVDWPAIFAGTALAVALSFVLLTFGSAIGLSVASFQPGEGASLVWLGIASGIWFLWVAITSFAAGGYVAGRLRRPIAGGTTDETETRDGAHGVLVWATGALVGAVMATAGVTGVVGAAGKAAGTAAETAAQAVSGDVSYLGSRLLRGSGGQGGDAGPQAAAVIQRSLASGTLAQEDRDYLAGMIAERTGQTPDQANAQIDAAMAEAKKAYETAVDAAEKTRVATAIAAFVVAATLIASAAAAYFAATTGGDHRDRNLAFRTFGR